MSRNSDLVFKHKCSVANSFVDLATFGPGQAGQYSNSQCGKAITYFVADITPSSWFTKAVGCMNLNASPVFGMKVQACISRQGDYLLTTWARIVLPKVELKEDTKDNVRIRWTKNIGHHIFQDAQICFNGLEAAELTGGFMDFWAAFTVPAGKRNGYNNMIGNVPTLGLPSRVLESAVLNVPLPFFYTWDTGVSLPTAALPYNEIHLDLQLRNWDELLIRDDITSPDEKQYSDCVPLIDLVTEPKLLQFEVFGHYALVSNEERNKMGCGQRDIVVTQMQEATHLRLSCQAPRDCTEQCLRFSHGVTSIFFGARNTTVPCQWANYTAGSPVPGDGTLDTDNGRYFTDPIAHASICYENSEKIALSSDFFSLVEPYYWAPVIPLETGYHLYTYSLDFTSIQPEGETNFSKLNNVQLQLECSTDAATVGAEGWKAERATGAPVTQKFELETYVVNRNIAKIAGGAWGFAYN